MSASQVKRYLVGCAGQFVLYGDGSGHLHGTTDNVDEAFVLCLGGPVGCEVFDRATRQWIGPTCMEEIEEAKARLEDQRAS